jgi:flagellar biosynthesis protein FlhB
MENQQHSKTEDATPFKLDDARKKGLVARGLDLGVFFSVAIVTGYLWMNGPELAQRVAGMAARVIVSAPQLAPGSGALEQWVLRVIGEWGAIVAPLLGIIALAGALAGLLQVGLVFAPAAIKPDFAKLNPARGLKRVFSVVTLVEAGKSVLKFAVYASIATWVIEGAIAFALSQRMQGSLLAVTLWREALKLLMWFALAAAAFAALDQFLVRRQFSKNMRMSRSEVRDETRHREGDPRIKQRRKTLQRELLKRSRSLRNVKRADMLIVNPSHFAIGLRYDATCMAAPTIVARGAGEFALRLKRVAFTYGVPILESPDVARGLYFKGQLEQEIPGAWIRETARLYLRLREQQQRRQTADS